MDPFGNIDENQPDNSSTGSVLAGIPILNIFGAAINAGEAANARQQAQQTEIKNAQALQLPQFGGQYQQVGYAGDYNPQMFGNPVAAQANAINEDPQARQTQLDALSKMMEQGTALGQAQQHAMSQQALSQANQMANARQGAIAQAAAARGQGGSGLNYLLQAQAGQDSAGNAQTGELNAAEQEALTRMAAEQGAFSGASTMRGQDLQKAIDNANVINQFNMYNTQMRNAAQMGNTQIANQAQLRNLGTQQQLAGENAAINNMNVDMQNKLAQQAYQDQLSKEQQLNGAVSGNVSNANSSFSQGEQAGNDSWQKLKDLAMGASGGM